ncbi:MAG TPA: hypothetical protein VGP07_00020 [Polyangia bacterium]
MFGLLLGLSAGSLGCGKSGSSTPIPLPLVYPPVRAGTPDGLIADPTYAAGATSSKKSALLKTGSALNDAINLATAVQERLYTMGPTEILRLVSDVDARTTSLDTRTSEHPCLSGAPVPFTYSFPGGQTFPIQLQCLEAIGGGSSPSGGWLAFGFDAALAAAPAPDGGDAEPAPDGGVMGTDGGGDHFYLAEGQNGGMGSVYRFDRSTGDVEGWISVADQSLPTGSQVIMHLTTNKAAGTLELTMGGSSVGFCAAHLKSGGNYLFIDAKTTAPPPPGTSMSAGVQYCDASRTGCFDTTNLATDLGGDAPDCAALARPTFSITTDLDASSDPGANVTPPTIYTYFTGQPSGIPAF